MRDWRCSSAAALAATIVMALGSAGKCDVIVMDDFEDGAFTGVENTTGLEWYSAAGGVSLSVIDDSAGLGGGQALSAVVDGVSLNTVAAEFTPVTLVDDGEFVSVTFNFRYDESVSSVIATTGFAPSFGLFDTNGTSGDTADDGGYSANFPSLGDGNISFGVESFNSDFGILAGDFARDQLGVATDEPALMAGQNYELELRVTKFPTGARLVIEVDGAQILNGLDSSNDPFLSFDGFALRNRFTDYVLDHLVIETGMEDIRPAVGDFNRDDDVDELDYFILRDNFGLAALPGTGDINLDGVTDLIDFDLFMGFFEAAGNSPASLPAIPEPATLLLVGPTMGLLVARRRRGGDRYV